MSFQVLANAKNSLVNVSSKVCGVVSNITQSASVRVATALMFAMCFLLASPGLVRAEDTHTYELPAIGFDALQFLDKIAARLGDMLFSIFSYGIMIMIAVVSFKLIYRFINSSGKA